MTPKPLTDEEIDGIAQRAEGATPGPWEWERGVDDSFGPLTGNYAGVDLHDDDAAFLRTAREDALRLASDLKACREALRFYGDIEKYNFYAPGHPLGEDAGNRARAALGVVE